MTSESERAVDLCETSAETGGLHRVETDTWPPVKRRGMPSDDIAWYRCVLCGTNVGVYPDNDPELSGIEVIVLSAVKKETAGKK